MPKGVVESPGVATGATRLREQIRELEIGFANLNGRGDGVLALLKLRDGVEDAVSRLEASGLDMRPERTRIETVDNIISRKAPQISHELGRFGGLEGARRRESPPEERWWWYVDLYHADKQRKALIRTLITVGAIIVVVLAINYVMDRYFGLDPVEKEARSHTSVGDQHLFQGEYDDAIAEYERAVAIAPNLGDAHVTLGVLYDLQGRPIESERAFQAAREALGDNLTFYLALGQAYEMVGEHDKGLVAIEKAIAIDPESPQAYLSRGGIYEATEEYGRALEDYELSSSLAQERQQDALYVMARTRMAMLMQRSPAFGSSAGP
jgi:tetratricopeptide (TPR) repeat protein